MINDKLIQEAIEASVLTREYSQCGISNQKIGASLIARNKEGISAIFSASNIELSTSINIHAEQLALLKAINEGFTFPEAVFVTSVSETCHVPMCLLCRGWYYYVNPDLDIYVVGLDKRIKMFRKLSDTVTDPYLGKSRLS